MTHHPFHMVERSPWPVVGAISAFLFTSSLVEMMHTTLMNTLSASALLTSLCMYQWWRDTTREATMQGTHTYLVKMGMKWGMLLFILSEIMFFTSFFWAYFHASLAPDHELGISWPPISLTPFNPYYIPLLNTTILLSSGATVTWSHHSLMEKKYDNAFMSLLLTILLGGYFTSLQLLEYWEAPFSVSDSVYGSTFFVTTGFHGLHVLIGSIFLCINLARMKMGHLSKSHHFSFEAAAWYWHFVDIVWLLLYTFMYWWPY